MDKFDPQALMAARKKLRISRRILSEASGVSQGTIYRIEKFEKPALVGTWEALTTTLKEMEANAKSNKKAARK